MAEAVKNLKVPVMSALAYPPTMAWVPMELAALNFIGNMAFMAFGIVFFNMSPLFFMGTTLGLHIFFIFVAVKEPHIVTISKARGKHKTSTVNLAPTGNVKYVP